MGALFLMTKVPLYARQTSFATNLFHHASLTKQFSLRAAENPTTLHPPPSTLHPATCTLHPPPSTLHPPPSTLHPPFASRWECGARQVRAPNVREGNKSEGETGGGGRGREKRERKKRGEIEVLEGGREMWDRERCGRKRGRRGTQEGKTRWGG